jgi:predicted nucleic acid-binding protein
VQALRLFLDTNIYILGAADFTTAEGRILNWLEQANSDDYQIELLVSGELVDQVARVAKRLTNKDNAGQLINRILAYSRICYVALNDDEIEFWLAQGTIPREDIEIYLTAKTGNAQCFISSNRKLIRALVEQNQEFECLTPAEFVRKYLPP